MHDYFEILGLPRGAAPLEVRHACRRRPAPWPHPDIRHGDGPGAPGRPCRAAADARPPGGETAVDFCQMGPIVERMLGAFFARGR